MSDPAWRLGGVVVPWAVRVIVASARTAVGIVFVYAGSMKILDPRGFAVAVHNYRILPEALVNLTAVVLPWVELAAGACLALGVWIPGAALLVSLLLSIFTAALGFDLWRGLDVACGCFGAAGAEGRITWWYLLRDVSLLAAALAVLALDDGRCTVVSLFLKRGGKRR
jgi:uncharacterized membrane protein YphA (DoxX/SURF4 family)